MKRKNEFYCDLAKLCWPIVINELYFAHFVFTACITSNADDYTMCA